MPESIRRRKAAIFQALGHPTRIAILELLENGELSAGELIRELSRGEQSAAQANVSQHLAVLRSQQIVKTRKAGNQVFYAVRDPVILEVLVLLRRYLLTHRNELLSELESEPVSDPEPNPQEAAG